METSSTSRRDLNVSVSILQVYFDYNYSSSFFLVSVAFSSDLKDIEKNLHTVSTYIRTYTHTCTHSPSPFLSQIFKIISVTI